MRGKTVAGAAGALALAAMALVSAAEPAGAVSITNDDPEHVGKVSVDFWIRRVEPGETVVFHPDSFPVEVYGQLPFATASCEVSSDEDVVSISGEGCMVNGESAGTANFRF